MQHYFKKIEKKKNDFIKDIFNVFYDSYDSDSEIVLKKHYPKLKKMIYSMC